MSEMLDTAAALATAAAVLAGMAALSPAHAGLVQADIFRNALYKQTSGAAPTAPTAYFFDAGGATSGAFSTATLTYPGAGSPQSLPGTSATTFSYGSGLFATKTAFDAAYPTGDYKITATGSGAPTNVTLHYATDAYTADIPALTAASYDALQGLDPANALTVDFNAFTPNAAASSSYTFFSVLGSSVSCNFLAPSATSCAIAADALLPGHTYGYELDFSDRIEATTGRGIFTGVDFDVRTDGTFTTAALPVPEPAALGLLAAGLAGLFLVRRRRA